MGAIADYVTLLSKMSSPSAHYDVVKRLTSVGPTLGAYVHSTWKCAGDPGVGATPTGSAVTDRSTLGGIGQANPSGGNELRAWVRRIGAGYNTGVMSGVGIQLIDRLVHMGGLDGTVTTAQTVSTSALTRFTGGCNAMAEIYTAVGTTATTFTVSYTNQDGTSGKTSQPVGIGAGGRSAAFRAFPISLAAGDTLVKAVSTLTLAATTGTAGNFGVTLYKPLSPIIPIAASGLMSGGVPVLDWGGMAALIPTDACLSMLVYCSGALTLDFGMGLNFFES